MHPKHYIFHVFIFLLGIAVAVIFGVVAENFYVGFMLSFLLSSVLSGLYSAYSSQKNNDSEELNDKQSFPCFIFKVIYENFSSLSFLGFVATFLIWVISLYNGSFDNLYPTEKSGHQIKQEINVQCLRSTDSSVTCEAPLSQRLEAQVISFNQDQVVSCSNPDAAGNIQCKVSLNNEQSSGLRGDLGAFGDYFGGILNPLIAFAGLIILLLTLRTTNQTLVLTRKELRETQEILRKQ